ncbi:MAG: hypothetical protein JW993_04805, partial [Sedimentisphaerales bacterium]|nr:hypothetical protein [Sedimentisphaerales bacterium]
TVNFALTRTITIAQMELVASITEKAEDGTLWVAGYRKTGTAAYGSNDVSYEPCLATVAAGATTAQALDPPGRGGQDLAMPTSILWTGAP